MNTSIRVAKTSLDQYPLLHDQLTQLSSRVEKLHQGTAYLTRGDYRPVVRLLDILHVAYEVRLNHQLPEPQPPALVEPGMPLRTPEANP